MSQYTFESLDRVCEELRAFAKARGNSHKGWTCWHADADLRSGGSLQMPSAALCDETTRT